MKKIFKLIPLLLIFMLMTGCNTANPCEKADPGDTVATIKTNLGSIVFKIYKDKVPEISKNFIELSNKGYYNGLIFHRVIEDFMIQGGDPKGDGTGGQSYKGTNLDDEFYDDLTHIKGAVSMANSGPNTNGSQFFIVTKNGGTTWLDGKHSVFGQIIAGLDIAEKISKVKKDIDDKPKEDVVMEEVSIQVCE